MATIVISMLCGVNVGSHKRMKMEALRRVYESLGLENPQTYLQSGNVVFKTRERDRASLAGRIENAIEQRFQFRSDVIIRTLSELRSVIARNPFAARTGIDPQQACSSPSSLATAARKRSRIFSASKPIWKKFGLTVANSTSISRLAWGDRNSRRRSSKRS